MSANRISKSERDDLLGQAKLRKEQAIGKIVAACPDWEREVEERARKLAVGHLGIGKELSEINKIKQQVHELNEKAAAIEKAVRKRLPKKGKGQYDDDTGCRQSMTICEALNVYGAKFMAKAREGHVKAKAVTEIEAKYLSDRAAILRAETRADLPSDCL